MRKEARQQEKRLGHLRFLLEFPVARLVAVMVLLRIGTSGEVAAPASPADPRSHAGPPRAETRQAEVPIRTPAQNPREYGRQQASRGYRRQQIPRKA